MKRTLVLHPRFDEDSQILWQAAVGDGWPVVRAQSGQVGDVADPVVYGGYLWAERVAAELGVSLISPPDDWLAKAPVTLTGRLVRRARLADIFEFPVFVKSAWGKSIESRVYHSRDDFPPGSDDEDVLVQPPVVWRSEQCAFVLDGRVCAISRYATRGRLDVRFDTDDCRIAQSYLESHALACMDDVPRAYVVDVGEMAGKGWRVVELNPSWCSGLYGCDPGRAIEAIAACTVDIRPVRM